MLGIRSIAALMLSAGLASPALAEERLALVVAQGDYAGNLAPLKKTEEEADAVAAALEGVGFRVTRAADLSAEALAQTFISFQDNLEAAGTDSVGFVYYTGHGAQNPDTKDSYLIGVDADIHSMSDLTQKGVSLQAVTAQFDSLGVRAMILVFDACRNVPLFDSLPAEGMKGFDVRDETVSAKGFAVVEAYRDTLISYATGIDHTAAEGVFAPLLADGLTKPYQSIDSVFGWTQRRVAEATGGEQKPWRNDLIYGRDLCLVSCAPDFLVAVGEDAGLNRAQAEAILAAFGYAHVPFEKWQESLVESAVRLKQLNEKLASIDYGGPEISDLIADVQVAIDLGDLAHADELLAEVARRDLAAGELRIRRAAESIEQRGDLAASEWRHEDAVAHYEEAANYMRPFDEIKWALLKSKQGNASIARDAFDPTSDLASSVAAFHQALTILTRENTPLSWAKTKEDLAFVLVIQAMRGGDSDLQDAINYYRDALTVHTRSDYPAEWAQTQRELGNALKALSKGTDEAMLWDASRAYRNALTVYSMEAQPLERCEVQGLLAKALRLLGEQGDTDVLRQSVSAYRLSICDITLEAEPYVWALNQEGLGMALQKLGEKGEKQALIDSIAAYLQSLKVFDRDSLPSSWANTQFEIARLYTALGIEGDKDAIPKAISHYNAALEVWTLEKSPNKYEEITEKLNHTIHLQKMLGTEN